MSAADQIRFENLLDLARDAAQAGHFITAVGHLREAEAVLKACMVTGVVS